MLSFFRKYQRYIYTLITGVIIISFSFFGTYGALTERAPQDDKVFTAVDGSTVTRSEMERMAYFIGTDATDMRQFGSWGPNFLNDGVIDQDLIQTGLATLLIRQYSDQIKPDLDTRSVREKRFQPYQHPAFKALSATEVWSKYKPQKMAYFKSLTASSDVSSPEAIDARINLYLSEREFSGQDLKQAILFAEKMNQSWVRPDPNLPYSDLSTFGYHTVDDWFGPKFVRLVSAFIINASKEAIAKGYNIPDDEVLADLIKNTQASFTQVAANGRLGVTNPTDYFREQLRRLHMDQSQAIQTWKQVMLFRRLFGDIGNAVVTDPLTAEQFVAFAKQTITGEVYNLPEGLHLGNFKDLQAFETYLKAVSEKTDDVTALPTTFKSVKAVPTELVEQRYLVEIAKVDSQVLATKVGVRETWEWEFADANWPKLVEAFPELGSVDGKTAEQREKALDRLDHHTRGRIDSFAREQILKAHPEWIAEALKNAPTEKKILSLREKGGNTPLFGVEDRKAFQNFLDAENAAEARTFTPNEKVYYSITVLNKDATPHILTFEQAKKEGILDEMATQELNDYYVKIREKDPTEYQLKDGEWKELQYVRTQVAKRYYSKILNTIQKEAAELQPKEQQPKEWTPDLAAAVRFIKHVANAEKALRANGESSAWISQPSAVEDGLTPPVALGDQWKLTKESFTQDRSEGESGFELAANSWSPIDTAPNGQIRFRHIAGIQQTGTEAIVMHTTFATHQLLSNTAQQFYMKKFLAKLNEKEAMTLDYLQPKE